MVVLSETRYDAPLTPMSEPMVSTSELILRRWMTNPCSAPNPVSANVVMMTAGTMPRSAKRIAIVPPRAATDPTDRSPSPMIIVTPSPTATSPYSEKLVRTA